MPPVPANVRVYGAFTLPFVSVDVEIASEATTLSVRLLVAVRWVGAVESVTVTDSVLLPAAVGVPVMAPVDAFTLKPAGRPVTAHA